MKFDSVYYNSYVVAGVTLQVSDCSYFRDGGHESNAGFHGYLWKK